MRKMDEDMQAYEERYNQNEQEVDQIKEDMQSMISYKSETEVGLAVAGVVNNQWVITVIDAVFSW